MLKLQIPIDKPLIIWKENISLIKLVINFTTTNTADIPIFNGYVYHAMIYNMIENIDPKLAYKLHKSKQIKPWSFSFFNLESFHKSKKRKGYFTIPSNTKGKWILCTTSKELANVLKKSTSMNLKKLNMKIFIKEYDYTYNLPPSFFEYITIKLHTPTVFYRHSEKKYLKLNEQNILEWTLYKMKHLGFIDEFDINKLLPYFRILRNDTRKHGSHIKLGNNKEIRIDGDIGFITFKINGNDEIKEQIL